MSVTLNSKNLIGKYILVYGYTILKDKAKTIEYLYDESLPCFDYISHEKRKNIKIITLGDGDHIIPYKFKEDGSEHHINVKVSPTFNGEVITDREADIIKYLTLTLDHQNPDVIRSFIEDAKKYVEDMITSLKSEKNCIKKYVYDEKNADWVYLNTSRKRSFDTLFLDKDVKEDIVSFIKEFVDEDVKKQYAKFNIPYKCNIMLHGVPGSGKSSTIMAIASELGSDISTIHFTKQMDDNMLMKAINGFVHEETRIIVMEDIDSIFVNRKEHDTYKNSVTLSGLLNALDGASRIEGVIIVMTTNHIEAIDEAMLRAGRVDKMIEYKNATRYQVEQMLDFYFPMFGGDKAKRFYGLIENKEVTCAALQQYFFKHRKNPERLLEDIDYLFQLIKPKGCSSIYKPSSSWKDASIYV